MKKYITLLILTLMHFTFLNSPLVPEKANDPTNHVIGFREVWGYMMRGEEKSLTGSEPVTDVFYFSCSLNYNGKLNINVEPPVLPELNGKKRRVHIVITELSNPTLSHLVLDPADGKRDTLISDIVSVSEKFDGVQIDFEAVAAGDGEYFNTFLSLLKKRLNPEKVLSIALPARRKYVADAYDYKKISSIVDRVFIMTYDEHWSTSKPGPVASYEWGRDVVNYASTIIPKEKLVMGLPLYGRSWQDKSFNRSVRTGSLNDLILKQGSFAKVSEENESVFKYSETVDITVYCDDIESTRKKMLLYRQFTDSVGFWRLGFEDRELWNGIEIRLLKD